MNALETGETSVTGFSLVREKSYNILKNGLTNTKANYSDVRKMGVYRPVQTCVSHVLLYDELCKKKFEI